MSSYVFPGHPGFVESAAQELGLPALAGAAGRIGPLTALANLCAQATQSHPAHAPGILARAAEFRDQLAIALRAAELMLAESEAARGRSILEDRSATDSKPQPEPALDPRKARKGPPASRDSS